MTTIDLLQRFPIHKDSVHHGKVPDEIEAFDSRKPGPTMPDPDPSQYSDAKAKLLHDMYDRAVMVIAKSQPEPKSEWEGTLWRDPRQPRARSPAYSDISDSFESSSRIEHCTNDLLSTPMTPASARFKGPDGWPLGIEVAMNDFHRGRLSTPVLQEKEFPNPLNLRKQKQKTPRFCDNGNRVRQETASGESVPSEKNGEGHHQQESPSLKALAYQKEQNVMLFQQYGERQDDPDSARLELLASQQQNYTLPQQQYDCRYQQESVDLNHSKLERQNDEDTILDIASIPTLSGLKYCDDQDSLGNASSELHPALANGNVPIGLGLENAGLELSDFQSYSQKHDGSHSQIDGTCLLNNDCPKTTRCDSPPRNKETHEDAHQAEPQINALADALDEKPNTSKVLGAFEGTGVESIDLDIGCQNTFEDNENNTLHGIGPLTSEDCKVNIDSDIFWKTSAPLEDILEESEDSFTSTLNLDQGQAQHFTPRSAEPLDLQKSSRAGERRDSMLALQGPQTEPFDLSSSPECVPPTLKLTTTPARRPQIESIEPSEHHHNGASSSAPTLSAATMAELKNHARPRGRLSAAALAEMRKVAKSQPHFQTGPDSPEDQSQAEIHPLLRSKSFSRPSSQVSKTVNDPPLRYVFNDNDSEGHEDEVEDSFSHQVTTRPRSLFQPEAQIAESCVTQISRREDPASQLDKTMGETVPKYLRNDDHTKDHEAECAGTFTSQRSTLRSSNDSTLKPSLEHAKPSSKFLPTISPSTKSRLSASTVGSPDVMPSSIFQSSISSSTRGSYSNSAIGSPAAYNSWASTPPEHDRGNSSSTPSSAATSTVPTPCTSFHINSPTSRGMTMTPSSSSGQLTGSLPSSRGITITPSSSFGQIAGHCPSSRGIPMRPSSSFGNSTGDRSYRRSVSASSMFARYHRARYPDLPTAAMTDSILSSKESDEGDQTRESTNDPFTTTRDDTTSPFSLNMKAPSKEDMANTLTVGVDQFNTPTKRTPNPFSLHRRSLSISGRPNTHEGMERTLSSMVFSPHRSVLHKRSHSTSTSIDTTAKPDGSRPGHRRSLSIATATVEQKWEIAPPPTPLGLRDEFSMRYRPEPLEADDHYSARKDGFQGMKQGLKKVFGRK